MALFRDQGPGGRIPPDGRPAQAPGIGANSRRHDLERPATPGLTDSSLQYGDVQRLENAQKIAPITEQGPAAPKGPAAPTPQPTRFQMPIPDPMDFLTSRAAGTLNRVGAPTPRPFTERNRWVPLFRRLANAPRSSALLRSSYVATLGQVMANPNPPRGIVIDLDELDEAVRAWIDGE